MGKMGKGLGKDLTSRRSAWCQASSRACLQLLPLGNLTPSTTQQWDMGPFDQSPSLPHSVINTSFTCILATPRF